MKAKRILSIIISMMMAVLLVGCGSSDKKAEKPAAKPADNKVVTIQVGYENATSEPAAKAVEKWAQLVNEKSKGSLQLKLFPNSALGKKTELIDQMVLGEPIITVADGAFLADYGVPDFGIFYAPYMFSNWDEQWAVIASPWYQDLCNQLAKKSSIRVISSNWVYGTRNIISNKPVVTPADLKGLKMRVSSNKLSIDSFTSLGASAIGMDMGDVYQALQSGTIDAVENPITALANRSFQEVSKHLVKNEHILATSMWICSDAFYQKLTPEQQKILVDSANEAGVYNNQLQDAAEAEATKKLLAAGVKITTLTPEQKAAWMAAGQPFYQTASEKLGWSKGLYDTVKAAGTKK